jgi:hypothetical protein
MESILALPNWGRFRLPWWTYCSDFQPVAPIRSTDWIRYIQPLLRRLAALGRGVFTQIDDEAKVASAMSALFSQLEAPMLRQIDVQWNDASAEAWPARVPDLYLSDPHSHLSLQSLVSFGSFHSGGTECPEPNATG